MHRFDGGGAERMTVVLANELYKRGYEVTFCVREDAGETRALLQKEIPVLDMKLMQVEIPPAKSPDYKLSLHGPDQTGKP